MRYGFTSLSSSGRGESSVVLNVNLENVSSKMCIRDRSVADDIASVIVDDAGELIHLLGFQELRLVDQKPVDHRHGLFKHILSELV